MVTIFLCDDNQQMLDNYSGLITKFASINQILITLSTFESGESLVFHLADSPNQADIIYLDILMGPLNGMVTAKKLRELGCNSEIIFLTTIEDYVFEAFEISPVQYLIKDSTSDERFEQILMRAISLAETKKTEMFVCESGSTCKVIPMKDISYLEIWKRVVMVHYRTTETFEYYGTMEQVVQQLREKDFIRVHRSYMVNLQYIVKFQPQSLLLKTGEMIPIGVTYLKLVKQAFSDYISRSNIYLSR
ncbi:DNA-binding response regulator [Paenibacillus selenitireducens]|uniref:DNA-binding response regulator n=1 Tax=Paenibacillus selenitireducens TaxID=1324314 RepID=A0A1T2XMU0_9BACL|nr:LytTR family DNA-binding domain-containing protein [Paenibacillus selenitireducens]OPA81184.1 DNA-binding response regulator [Paenibacillus selenitireducens]